MDLDDYYDNSLPSKSDFFNGIGSSSVEEINPLIHSYQEEGRAISPPPPPPPLPSQELVSFVENLNEPQAALPDGSHNGMKKASGPFPFLKKRRYVEGKSCFASLYLELLIAVAENLPRSTKSKFQQAVMKYPKLR